MKKIMGLLVILLAVGAVFAQEGSDEAWQALEDGTFEYNCETLDAVLKEMENGEDIQVVGIGEMPFMRGKSGTAGADVEVNVFKYVGGITLQLLAEGSAVDRDALFNNAMTACDTGAADIAADPDTFNVIVNGNVNLRSCAGTNCEVVQKANNGMMLTVIGEEGEWYQVRLEDGTTAYIASRLTERGPDRVIPTDEAYTDPRTGCMVAFNIKRGDMDMSVILAGERQSEVVVDLTRPRETIPLKVEAQLDKEFIDTGAPYILQYYRWNVRFPLGVYTLDVTLDGKSSRLAWEADAEGEYNIYVLCEE